MEIKIELDLPSIISQAVSAERIQPIVDKAIADAVKAAINDATGYRSEFQNAVISQMKDAMPHGIKIGDVAKFQHMINDAITNAVHGANAATIQAAMKKAVDHVVPDVPERIKLSDLMQEAREGFHKGAGDAFYANYKPSEYGGGWLSFDEDESISSSHSASIRLSIDDDGTVYALKLNGKSIVPGSVPDVIGQFDSLLLSMYVGRTSIDLDIDEYDVESLASEQYD